VSFGQKRREWGLPCVWRPVAQKPNDSSKRTVNHDRSGLWATDPLDEFFNERPASISPATPLPTPNKPVTMRPVARPAESGRAKPAVVETAPSGRASKNRKALWSFASGSAFGALVCVVLFSWLTSSEQPQAEPLAPRPEPISIPPAPLPVPPAAPETSPIADRAMRVVVNEPTVSPQIEKTPAATNTKKESFVGSLRIDSTPQGARVFIDRQAAGVTPLAVRDLRAGSHVVRVDADGHLPWSSAIRVIADRQTRVHTTLVPVDTSVRH
jgi:PEGA domain-containing protein